MSDRTESFLDEPKPDPGKEYRSACGCVLRVTQWTKKSKVVSQRSCPLHKSARETLAALRAVVAQPEHARDCSCYCDADEPATPHTSDGPPDCAPAHWNGPVHVGCSCGWVERMRAARAAIALAEAGA